MAIPIMIKSALKFLFVLLFTALTLSVLGADDESKPNIVFIFADDMAYETIGAHGYIDIDTPNLDRLVENGTTFSHTYNMGAWGGAVCVASRSMLVSGLSVWEAQSQIKELAENKGLWPQLMKKAGYDTYMTGKWHIPISAPPLFDHSKNIRAGMPKAKSGGYDRPASPEAYEKGWKPWDKKLGGFWEGGKHWSEVLADDGEAMLKQAANRDQPFFMYLAFNAPHDPRQAPKEFLDQYAVDDVKVQANFLPEYPYNESIGCGRSLRDERLAPFPRTRHAIKVTLQEYYALITHMDVQIGRILDALEATGKADNTYIFFTADHGLAVGEHGFLGKQNMYDASMRVPMLMAGPGIEAGKTIQAPVYLQDVMATSLELAGIEKPKQVEFNSLLPLAKGETDASAYDDIYGAYFGKQRMYRNDRYKLIIYPAINRVRLYDMVNDPQEINDLAEQNPRPVELLKELFSKFQDLQKVMNDPADMQEAFDAFLNQPLN